MGQRHSCLAIPGGTVQCWGYNNYGEVGDGSTTDRHTAVTVSGIATAASVDAGVEHSCAALADGAAQCWGRNDKGQLGDSTQTNSNTPVQV